MNDNKMVPHSILEFEVQWGDCDPADIVYYPNYYRWFDNATHRMFDRAGFGLVTVREQHLALGFPLVNAQAQFRSPAHAGDQLRIASTVIAIGRKSISVEHRVMRDETVLVEGREIRIMGIRNADGVLQAAVIPDALRQFFGFLPD